MVETVTEVTEAKLNTVGEKIHFDGETVAIFGEYDDGMTYSEDEIRAAIDAIEGGAEEVVFDEDRRVTSTPGDFSITYRDENDRVGARETQLYDGHRYPGDGLEELLDVFDE